MFMRALLDQCADMEVRCLGGDPIKANTFTMAASCTLIRTLVENFEPTKEVLLPIEDDRCIRVAVDVIHGVRCINTASYDDVDACSRGFAFLGCTMHRKKVQARVWHFVSRSRDLEFVFSNAQRLMLSGSSGTYVNDYLNTVKSLCPSWKDFRAVFDHFTMTEPIAIVCMGRLCKYFPAHLVFDAIVEAFPPAFLTYATCLNVIGSYRTGPYHHPDEVVMTMNNILARFPNESVHLQTISDAMCMYEASPGTNLTATTLTYSTEPRASVLIKIYEPYQGTKTLRVKRFLNVTVNTITGTISGRIAVDKLDEHRYFPRAILVRVMTYNAETPSDLDVIDHKYTIQEAWREFTHVDATLPLHDPDVSNTEADAAIETAVRDVQTLRYIRLDFFFGHGDIRRLHVF
jgi:hypothetical protein